MKQLKFLLTALTVAVMSMSVTSCLNGENNTQINDQPIVGKVKDSFLNLTFVSMDGYTFKSINAVENMAMLNPNDFIVALCSYDSEADIDVATKTINAKITSVEKISGNGVWGTTKDEDKSENSAHASNRGVISASYFEPVMFDNTNILIPVQYYAFEKIESHTFSLVYYTDQTEMDDKSDLKLYLRHTSTEEDAKELYRAFSYKVFDINNALYAYLNVNGKYPSKITIVSEVNLNNNDVPATTTSTSIDYKFTE